MRATSATWKGCAACSLAPPSSRPFPRDYDEAAVLYRRCRRQGESVRKLMDCLIASVAIRAEVPILHCDADFDVLARHTALRIDR